MKYVDIVRQVKSVNFMLKYIYIRLKLYRVIYYLNLKVGLKAAEILIFLMFSFMK